MSAAASLVAGPRAATSRATRALAWKDARELTWPVTGAVVALVVVHALVSADLRSNWGEVLVLLVAPTVAAIFGGVSMAGESADGTQGFLRARPVPLGRILGVKLVVHALAALVVVATALVLASRTQLGGDAAWSVALDAPSRDAWITGACMVPPFFACGVLFSLVLPDGLSAAPAGAITGMCWFLLVMALPLRLAQCGEVAFGGIVFALPLLVFGPALAARALARRDAWLGAESGTLVSRPIALAGLASLVGFALAVTPALRQRAVRVGHAHAGGPVFAAPHDAGVAFVAAPEGGATRAVVASADASRLLAIAALAPGTVPVGWSEEDDAFLVRWSDGAVRAVSIDGAVRAAHGTGRDGGPGIFHLHQGWIEHGMVQADPPIIFYPTGLGGRR